MSDTFQGKGRPDHRRGPRPRSAAGAALRPKGASIVGTDLCGRIATVKYPTSTCTHLNQTVNQAEEVGQKMVAGRRGSQSFWYGAHGYALAGLARTGSASSVNAGAALR
jgi:hypothetical protein